MKKWNLVIDVDLCNNCANCQLATMDEYARNDFPGYSDRAPDSGAPWIQIERIDRGQGTHVDVTYVPQMCNHCDAAPCGAGRDPAVQKRSDGIVLLVPELARGRKDLVEKCPYGAMHWNEQAQAPQLWNFDAHLLDAGWQQPRCAHACPTGAMAAHRYSDDELAALVRQEKLQPLSSTLDTRPRVYYKNLFRRTSRFIAATIVGERQGVLECLEGVRIKLVLGTRTLQEAVTDCFGDFKFDGLPGHDETYGLLAESEGFHPLSMTAALQQGGLNLGELLLQRVRA